MKPLSKKQRETLQLMEKGKHIFIIKGVALLMPGSVFVHEATFNSLLNKERIEAIGLDVFYKITPSGLEALAKPTRNRGKKPKRIVGDFDGLHKKILI